MNCGETLNPYKL